MGKCGRGGEVVVAAVLLLYGLGSAPVSSPARGPCPLQANSTPGPDSAAWGLVLGYGSASGTECRLDHIN